MKLLGSMAPAPPMTNTMLAKLSPVFFTANISTPADALLVRVGTLLMPVYRVTSLPFFITTGVALLAYKLVPSSARVGLFLVMIAVGAAGLTIAATFL